MSPGAGRVGWKRSAPRRARSRSSPANGGSFPDVNSLRFGAEARLGGPGGAARGLPGMSQNVRICHDLGRFRRALGAPPAVPPVHRRHRQSPVVIAGHAPEAGSDLSDRRRGVTFWCGRPDGTRMPVPLREWLAPPAPPVAAGPAVESTASIQVAESVHCLATFTVTRRDP